MTEALTTFACFGSECAVSVLGDTPQATASESAAAARGALLEGHRRFSRFLPDSELSLLNADPAVVVAVSAPMAAFVAAALEAARQTHGLVDATLLGAVLDAGYVSDLRGSVPLELALALAPPRRAARPSARRDWESVRIDLDAPTVARPPGVGLDSGGIAKGLLADAAGADLAGHASFAVDCAGDLLLGGTSAAPREVRVAGPFDGSVVHTYALARGAVATSGIGRRSWLDRNGRPAHHLLDPASGRPAYTGVVQVTALAGCALDAEVRAKAALLSGPEYAREWLPDGGVLVYDDGGVDVLGAARAVAA